MVHFLTQFLVAVSIAAPGLLSFRAVMGEREDPMRAIGAGLLFSAMWAAVVGLILAATAAHASLPGALWAALATAVLAVELFFVGRE